MARVFVYTLKNKGNAVCDNNAWNIQTLALKNKKKLVRCGKSFPRKNDDMMTTYWQKLNKFYVELLNRDIIMIFNDCNQKICIRMSEISVYAIQKFKLLPKTEATERSVWLLHYNDVIMGAMAAQTTSLTIVYSTVYSGADQRKYQSSASLAFVRGFRRWPVNSLQKWSVTRKMFPFDDVIMDCRINVYKRPVRTREPNSRCILMFIC